MSFNRTARPLGRSGMTLVEIMVAMTVFAIVLAGILPLSIYVISYNRENTRLMQARNLMANLVEQLKSAQPTNAWRTNDADNADSLDNAAGDHSITNGAYTIRWNIWDGPSSTQNFRIFVNWNNGKVPRTISSSLTLII
jgi:prepilin-type N-terminal cleavage/methylation domain-containing protein